MRPRREGPWERVVLGALILVMGFSLALTWRAHVRCREAGGQLLRDVWGWPACVKVAR